MTTTETTNIISALNEWTAGADASDPETWDGRDIWTELIVGLAGYDAAATESIDPGNRGDRFVAAGETFRWFEEASEWRAV